MTSTEEDNNQVGRMISFVDSSQSPSLAISVILASETMNKMVMVTMIEVVNELINMHINTTQSATAAKC